MRKTILWLIILCCAGIGFWFFRKSETGPALSDALPADALVAIELIDLENRIDRLKAGRLGKTLKTIDVQDLMTRLDAPPDAINDYHEIETALVTITDSMIFKELFGQHTLIAVLPAEPAPVKSVFTQNPVHDPFDPIVVVSRPKAGGELAEFFSFIFSKRFKIETEAFHNHQVKRFQVDDNRTVHYTLVKGLLVAAAKRRNLEACLLVFDGNQDSLTQNVRYQTPAPGLSCIAVSVRASLGCAKPWISPSVMPPCSG